MVVDRMLRESISEMATIDGLRDTYRTRGGRTLLEQGIRLAEEGKTHVLNFGGTTRLHGTFMANGGARFECLPLSLTRFRYDRTRRCGDWCESAPFPPFPSAICNGRPVVSRLGRGPNSG